MDQNGKHTIVTIDEEPYDIISTFDRKGEHIILGNSRGLIVIKTFPDLKTISSFRITTGTSTNTVLRHIEIPRRGMTINSFFCNLFFSLRSILSS
jgi:COMPASS component SWD1